MNPQKMVPAVAHVRLTWVTRLFCPASRRDHDGGVFVLGVGGFPLHIKLHSNMRNASRHVVV